MASKDFFPGAKPLYRICQGIKDSAPLTGRLPNGSGLRIHLVSLFGRYLLI